MVNLTHTELAEITTQSLPAASLEALETLRREMCTASFALQPQQKFLRRVLSPDSPTRNLLMVHGTGVGKCHGRGTPILMYDGSTKLIEDVSVGDHLMGDDSTPRIVESLARGRDQMFKVTSVKGDSYVVNSEHILCLQHTSERNTVFEITVTEFLKLSKKLQRNLKGYRTAINFPYKPIDFDPYILGVWLGDGSQRDPVISSQDSAILFYLREFCQRNHSVLTFQSGYDYRISSVSRHQENVFLSFLKRYNLLNNKHVPELYKVNSEEVRLQVLAGLMDTDGTLSNNTYEIIQKSKQITDDIVFLARSLGLATTTQIVEKSCIYKGQRVSGKYYRTFISGNIDRIPVKLLRKKAVTRRQIKDVLRYGITLTPLGEDDYYGFILDGNHRYVLGDFTVTHNTCSAIQVAEEYILRPEFQDKKVMVVASRAVQENFRTQIFDMSRVNLDTVSNTLSSKQCTGRRYLDMLLRIESEPKNWANPEIVSRLETTSDRIIDEFYEFTAYASFGIRLLEKLSGTEKDIDTAWIHENFDNRLLIIDEAHNIRSEETQIASGLEKLVKVADGLVLVLLTATPMFDSYEEILFYMNLFLWNDRKQTFKKTLKASDFFTNDAELKVESEGLFRQWCQDYVSYVRGESPFTFPFRLPPPVIACPTAVIKGFNGATIADQDRIKYLTLVASQASGLQQEVLRSSKHEEDDTKRQAMIAPTITVFPKNKKFKEVFNQTKNQYSYVDTPFLTPALLPEYAGKFVTVLKSIEKSSGVCLVYSNYVERGALPFAMALEEHGYAPHSGNTLLVKSSYTGTPKGKYILLSSNASDAEISSMLSVVKNRSNVSGKNIKIVVTSPLAAEGIDFRFIRQVHILDPWWNMSRIEQVVGRALRTCSHQDLVTKEQNCTVYLHVIRTEDTRETFDEYTYRTKVEVKGIRIAKVRKLIAESAMDCPIQLALPSDWKELVVPQIRDEGHQEVSYPLKGMLAPTFDESPEVEQCKITPSVPDPDHVRPLSSYLDSRDEILAKVGKLFIDKSIWDREQLFTALRPFSREVVIYILQQAISSSFRFVDSFGRPSVLESKGDLYALAPLDVPNRTLIERTTQPSKTFELMLPTPTPVEETPQVESNTLDIKRDAYKFPGNADTRFSKEVRNGYIFDHVFTPAEKKEYLKRNPNLPFADRLKIPDTDIWVTGDDMELVGEDLTRYNEWKETLVSRYVKDKTKIIASMAPNGLFTLTPSEDKENIPVRTSNSLVVCKTGKNSIGRMKEVVKFLDVNKVGVPKDLTGDSFCAYAELLAREQHHCAWYTPEEIKVLNLPDVKKKLKRSLA